MLHSLVHQLSNSAVLHSPCQLACAAQPGSAAASSSSAASLARTSANEPLQRSLLDYGANPDDLADLRRAMGQIRLELARLKNQTAANDTAIETLAAFVKQAMQLNHLPTTERTLRSHQMTSLFVDHCGRLQLRKEPHRGEMRDYKTVSCIACRSLVAAVQKFLSGRPALNKEPFLS